MAIALALALAATWIAVGLATVLIGATVVMAVSRSRVIMVRRRAD